ncbi:hypothetical protein [Azohydromonas aeria]|uniref:hypothetical protein n=1 Tax=Azohydromonas aeria TaxID=2590212 RepID=UPI0012FABE8C|nr:hypothetical protein [Azohydromonas aeria]
MQGRDMAPSPGKSKLCAAKPLWQQKNPWVKASFAGRLRKLVCLTTISCDESVVTVGFLYTAKLEVAATR